MAFTAHTLVRIMIPSAVLGGLPVAAQHTGASGDDICFPDQFAVRNAVYLPDTPDQVRNPQYFDLARSRERFDTFQSDTEVLSFLDDFATATRYVLVGRHKNEENVSFDMCFTTVLEREFQPVCFGRGLERQESFSYFSTPVHRSTLRGNPPNEETILIDALWTQVGTVTVPLEVVERQVGSSLQAIRFENVRFEFDPSLLDIPAICPVSRQQTGPDLQPGELFAEWDALRRTYPYRRFFGAGE